MTPRSEGVLHPELGLKAKKGPAMLVDSTELERLSYLEHAHREFVGSPTRAPSAVTVELQSLSKHFGVRPVLQGISLAIAPGEFVAIVGQSGCGKSTLLRILAGLEHADEDASGAAVKVNGRSQVGPQECTRLMFQEARLLPWKTVFENVALGLSQKDRVQVGTVLRQVGLADRGSDWPAVLSGGQRQRVALARALVHRPGLLLLDEPLGALDALTRIEMQRLIEQVWQRDGFTAVLVTHDVPEAVALADRVLLIEEGRIALDVRVDLPRPRQRGHARFAALEAKVLDRVLREH